MADTKPEEEAKKIEITITTPEKLNKSKSPEPKETPKEIRAWFAGLSAIERATVLGFTDGPMVETLLRLASSSSSVFPSIRVQENRTTDVPISRDAIEWEALVAWNSVKATLEKVEGTYDASTVVEEVVRSPIQSEQEENSVSVAKKIDSPEEKVEGTPESSETPGASDEMIKDEEKVTEAVADSEEFRIQPQPSDSSNAIPADFESTANEFKKIKESSPEESPSEEYTTPGEESKATAEDNEEAKSESTSPEVLPTNDEVQMEASSPAPVVESRVPAAKVLKMMEKVYAIFPAAFNFSSPESAEGSIPFITIQPSYLATVTGQDLLLAFDEIMHPRSTGETFSFLSNDVSSSVCPSWLESIQASSDISAPDSPTIPLYMLLLSRFEMSILKSFAAVQATDAVSVSEQKASIEEATGAKDSDVSPRVTEQESEGQDDKPEEPTEDVAAPAGESQKASPANKHEDSPRSLDNIPAESKPSESKHRPIDSKLLNSVVSRAASLSQLQTSVDKAVVRRSISFFVDAFLTGSPKIEPDFALEHLLLTPVNFLVRRLPVTGADGEISSTTLNDALALSLQQVLTLSTKKESETSATVSATPTNSSDAPEPSPQASAEVKNSDATSDSEKKNEDDWMHEPATANGSNGPAQKKNSKKKKKRKKRKISNFEQLVANQDVLAEDYSSVAVDVDVDADVAETEEIAPERMEEPMSAESANPEPEADGAEDGEAAADVDSDQSGNSEPNVELNGEEEAADNVESPEESNDLIPVEEVNETETAPVVVAQPNPEISKAAPSRSKKDSITNEPVDTAKDDNSAWETVEVRCRGNRNKSSRSGRQQSYGSSSSSMNGHHGGGSKKAKSSRTSASRKRTANRKIVREILSSVLDTVDEEARRRRIRDGARLPGNKWAAAVARSRASSSNGRQDGQQSSIQKKETTIRDVLVGRQAANGGKNAPAGISLAQRLASRQRQDARGDGKNNVSARHVNENRKIREKSDRPPAATGTTPNGQPTAADQNTAPTVPETLSAVSANSVNTDASRGAESKKDTPVQEEGEARSESSSEGSAQALKTQRASNTQQTSKEASPAPPLPTLLSSGNANSASSSVASSLDAPHAGHHPHHHSFSAANENDVGYHLLDVCDRLTKDMNVFMKRRALALDVRRRERGAVLVALQESLTNLWPGRCTVDMYGSCATQTDLPSSDLDVVVCGLDRPVDVHMSTPPTSQNSNNQSTSPAPADETIRETMSPVSVASSHDSHQQAPHQITPIPQQHAPMMYSHLSMNAERVLRLAAELERQPWAVHVKAIPTATVPVIKILADPARLPGAMTQENGGDWLMQQHQMAAQSGATGPHTPGEQVDGAESQQASLPTFHPSQAPPTWRGADVVNGLLKVDITFDGPEHGGIGSTEFSSRVIQDVCNETGLQPEGTPAVQVLLVLKELLAQRRLNEPFSGGLSSYSLLLLVISVLRERGVICEELERVECQRRMVAAGGGNSTLRGASGESGLPPPVPPKTGNTKSDQKSSARTSKAKKQPAVDDIPAKTATSPQTQKQTNNAGARSKGKESKKTGEGTSVQTQNQVASAEKYPSKQSQGGGGAPSSSWASIAKNSSSSLISRKTGQESLQGNASEKKAPAQKKSALAKKSSFADMVANGTPAATQASKPVAASSNSNAERNKTETKKAEPQKTESESLAKKKDAAVKKLDSTVEVAIPGNSADANKPDSLEPASPSKLQVSSSNYDPILGPTSSLFPQGFHDVIEVLCSGETTAGKHQRGTNGNNGYSYMSPYMQRRTAGSYDPMTGMLTVDPIVVYDPLEGAENNNVARSCFAWSSIRWVFTQSYMTLSSVVEMSATPGSGQTGGSRSEAGASGRANEETAEGKASESDMWKGPYSQDESGNMMVDPSQQLLELLLSF